MEKYNETIAVTYTGGIPLLSNTSSERPNTRIEDPDLVEAIILPGNDKGGGALNEESTF